MLTIGLTGGIGSGKTYVADQLQALGAGIVDTDVIAHQLTTPQGLAIPAITAEFGADYLDEIGALNRAKMRHLVFSDNTAKSRLEAILHPLIRSETQRQSMHIMQEGRALYLVLVIPLLIESGNWKERANRILVVDCPTEVQIQRVMQRNGITQVEVEAIMRRQASRTERLAHADDVLDNSGELKMLNDQIAALHQKYLQLVSAQSVKT